MRKIEDIGLVGTNVRMWRHLAVLYPTPGTNWRKFAFVLPVTAMNLMQFVYLLRMWGDLPAFILNMFFFSAIFNALMRTWLVIIKRDQFELFLGRLCTLFHSILESSDEWGRDILRGAEREARNLAILNLSGLLPGHRRGSNLAAFQGGERLVHWEVNKRNTNEIRKVLSHFKISR